LAWRQGGTWEEKTTRLRATELGVEFWLVSFGL